MSHTLSIFKGDTAGPWHVGHLVDGSLRPLNDADTCIIKVAGTLIERSILDRTGDGLNFVAALLPAETDTLTAGQQYVVIVQIENQTLTPPLRLEHHTVLSVKEQGIGGGDYLPEPPTTIDRLNAHREKLLDARDEAISGMPVEVWNGRYGNKMKYQAMTYDQICSALSRVEREIAAEEARLAGRPRRAPVSLVWTL